jgi:hypothetical protein
MDDFEPFTTSFAACIKRREAGPLYHDLEQPEGGPV